LSPASPKATRSRGAVGPDAPVLRKPFGIEQLSAIVAEQLAIASGA
jgi:hypothetical protein